MAYTHEHVEKHVRFCDSQGQMHEALVTQDFSTDDYPQGSVNLVIVCSDPEKIDPHGRQIERFASVPHRSHQSASGMFWDE